MGEARDCAVIGEITLPGVRRSVGCARSFVREVVGGRLGPDGMIPDGTVAGGADGTVAGGAVAGGADGTVAGGADGTVPGGTVLDDMVMVASETVANAITHTASGREGGEVTLVLRAGDGVYRLEVADDGAAGARPHVKEEVGAETGRGMRIVEALASRWGFRVEGARTVVWAEFPAPAAEGRGRGRVPLSGPG
ncbi:ATP-binding protein [Actinomadura sp. 3N407]|uniref:ATP-binding protein n=1 Tax=Actinomadura sp. 3N407 TaxID=3457423 RepID=UPI003FCDA0D6